METWGSRVVTTLLGVVGGAVVLGAAWLLATLARFEGPAGLQVALVMVCAPIALWLVVTSELPQAVRRRFAARRRA